MTIQQAKELAIKGGFTFNGAIPIYDKHKDEWYMCGNDAEWFMSPDFWRCLSEESGWGDFTDKKREYLNYSNGSIFGYIAVWHNFIDALAAGQTPEQFFEKL